MEQKKKSVSRVVVSADKAETSQATPATQTVKSKPSPSSSSAPAWPSLTTGVSPMLSQGITGTPSTSGSKRSLSPPVAQFSSSGPAAKFSCSSQSPALSLLTGVLELAGGLSVSQSPAQIPQRQKTTVSPEKKKPKTISTREEHEEKYLNDLVNREKFTQFKSLNENEIKRLIRMFDIKFNTKEDAFDVLREKVFSHVRFELQKRLKGDTGKYKRLLIQLSLPCDPKIVCCVCLQIPGRPKVHNKADIKELSEDQCLVAKFTHNYEENIQFLCSSHYKDAFAKFSGLNKNCSNPFKIPGHIKCKTCLSVPNLKMLADVKR